MTRHLAASAVLIGGALVGFLLGLAYRRAVERRAAARRASRVAPLGSATDWQAWESEMARTEA